MTQFIASLISLY